jgi:hypothetical protein
MSSQLGRELEMIFAATAMLVIHKQQTTAHDLQFTSCQFACGVLRPRALATYDIGHRPSPDKVFEQAIAILTSLRVAFSEMALPTTLDGQIRAASVAGVPLGGLT